MLLEEPAVVVAHLRAQRQTVVFKEKTVNMSGDRRQTDK